jgi:hypothetical protein
MTTDAKEKLKKLVTAIREDLERYLEDPSDFRSEYFEDVCTAAQMAEEILKNEGGAQ